MTAWDAYSAADFDAKRADRRALRAAREAAETGQAGLFFVATPERETAAPERAELPGQDDLFSVGEQR